MSGGHVSVAVDLRYRFARQTDVLLQVEAAEGGGQSVLSGTLDLAGEALARVAGEAGIGTRGWVRVEGDLCCAYRAEVAITRTDRDFRELAAMPPAELPAEVVGYLLPSRYCDSSAFETFAAGAFAGLSGGARAAAIGAWVADALVYVPGSSTGQTTAADTFVTRQGVCRDYAHLVIALARASAIPARFASVYAPDVVPQDFHAVAEVYLAGGWHMIDATGMTRPAETVRIGVGQDAAGVAFLTSFGPAEFVSQRVEVMRLAP
ncbi:MAG: transglutaminase family protein [Pseudomonadota bacterium]